MTLRQTAAPRQTAALEVRGGLAAKRERAVPPMLFPEQICGVEQQVGIAARAMAEAKPSVQPETLRHLGECDARFVQEIVMSEELPRAQTRKGDSGEAVAPDAGISRRIEPVIGPARRGGIKAASLVAKGLERGGAEAGFS